MDWPKFEKFKKVSAGQNPVGRPPFFAERMPMSLFESLVSFRGARKAQRIADELADRLTDRVWEEAGVKARHFSLAEARGYFRAHSNRIVRAEMQRSQTNAKADKLGPWQWQAVESLACETIVIRVLQQLLRYRKQHGEGTRRKAA